MGPKMLLLFYFFFWKHIQINWTNLERWEVDEGVYCIWSRGQDLSCPQWEHRSVYLGNGWRQHQSFVLHRNLTEILSCNGQYCCFFLQAISNVGLLQISINNLCWRSYWTTSTKYQHIGKLSSSRGQYLPHFEGRHWRGNFILVRVEPAGQTC